MDGPPFTLVCRNCGRPTLLLLRRISAPETNDPTAFQRLDGSPVGAGGPTMCDACDRTYAGVLGTQYAVWQMVLAAGASA